MSDHETKHEEWRECAEWLNKFHVLPDDHVTLSDNGNAINLLQALQDGVILCNLAVNISAGEIDLKSYKNYNSDPQNSQFLCCHNIKLFLDLCENHFKIDKSLLFSVNDLYQANNFGKVISLLLELRKSNLTSRRKNVNSNAFGGKDSKDSSNSKTEYNFEDTIYDTVLYQGHVKKVSHSTPRDHCVKEIIDTEKNYVDLLNMLLENYKKPLSNVLSDQELSEIFKHIDKLSLIHKELYRNLLLATQSDSPPFTVSQVFIRIRDSLLIYGEYSGHLLRAKSLVRDIVNNDEEKKKKIDLCRESADDKCKFELVELLTVPMQRVLKYHLLLEQLCKLTDNENPEKSSLIEAHSAMKDLADFTNEVKRDLDMINSINRIQECLEDLYFPPNKSLKSYGRLQMDGELRVSVDGDNKIRSRYVFLFDRMFLICKQKGPNYTFMKAYFVTSFPLERIDSPVKKNNKQWTYGFRLFLHTEKDKNHVNFYAKSEEVRSSWYDAIEIAKDNVCPPGAREKNYFFEFFDFPEYAYCSICKKILKGCFFQGYRCKLSGLIAHKQCLSQNNLKPFQILTTHQQAQLTPQLHSQQLSTNLTTQQILRPTPSTTTNNVNNSLPVITNNNSLLPNGIFDGNICPSNIAVSSNAMASQINSSGYNSAQLSRNISSVSSNAAETFLNNVEESDVVNKTQNSNFNMRRRSSVNESCISATPPGSISSGNRTKQMATPNQSPLHSNHGSFCGSLALVLKPYTCSTNPKDYTLVLGESVIVLQNKQHQTLIQKDNRLEFWVPSAILEIMADTQSQQHSFDLSMPNNNNANSESIFKLSSHHPFHSQLGNNNNFSLDCSDNSFGSPSFSHHLMSNANRRHTTDLRHNPDFASFNRCTSLNQSVINSPSTVSKANFGPGRSSLVGCTNFNNISMQTSSAVMLSNQLSRLKVNEDLSVYPWFLGNMDRNDAMAILQNCDNGTFLVRVSQNHERLGELSLSLVYQEPRHIRIHRKFPADNNNQQVVFYLSPAKYFTCISNLVDYYQKNSLENCFEGICTSLLYPYIRCPNLINPILGQVIEQFNPEEEYQTINSSTDIYAQIPLIKGELVVIMDTMDLERFGYFGYCQAWRRGRVGIFPKNLVHINNV